MDKGLRQKMTIARWREAYQNDLRHRIEMNLLPLQSKS